MGRRATLSDRLFSAGNAFKDSHALLHKLLGLNVEQIGAWQAMLGDENWLLIPLDIGEEFSGLAFESCDEFGTHKVTLQYHYPARKWPVQRPNA